MAHVIAGCKGNRKVWLPFHRRARREHPRGSKGFEVNAAPLECKLLKGRNRLRGKDCNLQVFCITKPGLLAMTISVVALWSCIALEQAALHRGAADARACARALEELRERSVPASTPIRFHRQLPKMS